MINSIGIAYNNQNHFQYYSFNRHDIGENDILIKIQYAGICHSDLHTVKQHWGKAILPLVPGHEILGLVERVGSKVTKFKVGDYAGIGCLINSCGECPDCQQNHEQYCYKSILTYGSKDWKHDNIYTQGGYSNNYVVSEDFAIKVPKDADLKRVPSLMCAGITVYSPIKESKVQKGDKVAVIGIGGLGHMALQYLQLIGCDVTGYDIVDKSDVCKKYNAHFIKVDAEHNNFEDKRTFDFLLSTVPYSYNLKEYVELVKRYGKIAIVGLPKFQDMPELSIKDLIFEGGNITIMGSQIGGIDLTQRCVDTSIKNNIYPDVEEIQPTPQSIEKAYSRLLKGDIKSRFVMDMTKMNFSEGRLKVDKKQEGGPVKQNAKDSSQTWKDVTEQYKTSLEQEWPVLKHVQYHIVEDPQYLAGDYGYGDIETFIKASGYDYFDDSGDITLYTYPNPYPEENTIVYNPDRISNPREAIKLDLLHVLRADDPEYKKLLKNIRVSDDDEIIQNLLQDERNNKTQGLSREQRFNNAIDGFLRGQLVQGTPEEIKAKNYDPESDRKWNPTLLKSVQPILKYITKKSWIESELQSILPPEDYLKLTMKHYSDYGK